MKKTLPIFLTLTVILLLAFQLKLIKKVVETATVVIETPSLINKDRLTIQTRVNVPEGYKRVNYEKGSFEEYLKTYKLKTFGSKIIDYDDSEYFWQGGHISILDIPVPKN